MMRGSLALTLAGLMLLPSCGRGENPAGQPSADERKKLEDIARKRDEEQSTFDTSPDSLVPAEEGAGASSGATASGANVSAVPANSANAATPR